MARPKLRNLSYFPFNVDFFEDDKIQLIEAEYGVKGVMIAIRLLCKIYKENGYYYQWGDDQCLLFAKKAGDGIGPGLVTEVVNGLIKRSFFEEGVYNSFRVLTSKGIQERYIKALDRSDSIEIIEEFLCKNVVVSKNVTLVRLNVTETQVNVTETQVNATLMPQRKEKEIKEKEIKEKEIKEKEVNQSDFSSPPQPQLKINFIEIKNYFNENRKAMPELREMTDARKNRISILIKNYGFEKFKKVLDLSKESDFLNGINKRNWIASFDWIIHPQNFIKILEENYKNKNNGQKTKSSKADFTTNR